MIPENDLIAKARIGLIDAAEQTRNREQADRICASLRVTCDDLLLQNGEWQKAMADRILFGIVAGSIVGLLFAAEMESMHWGRYHAWERSDKVLWKTSLNGLVPEVPIEISSVGGRDPKKAARVNVFVGGLDEYLRLYEGHGELASYHPDRQNDPNWGGYRYVYKKRRANLTEALQWQDFIEGLTH